MIVAKLVNFTAGRQNLRRTGSSGFPLFVLQVLVFFFLQGLLEVLDGGELCFQDLFVLLQKDLPVLFGNQAERLAIAAAHTCAIHKFLLSKLAYLVWQPRP